MTVFCAAADWGTTRFRLWLLSADGEVLQETRSDEGLIASGRTGFGNVLEYHLSALGCDDRLPVVICGMAGARQGWAEARYVDAPADLHDVISNSVRVRNHPRDVRILPGIAQRNEEAPDVMRGEETQLLGLYNSGALHGRSMQMVCMPGTHSKWVELEGSSVRRFSTFMSGELFSVLAQNSVLKMSVAPGEKVAPDHSEFLKSVKRSLAKPETLSARLFSIRPSQLLGFTGIPDGLSALSGSLIGAELAGAFAVHGRPHEVLLLASGNLGDLYEAALAECGISVIRKNAETAGREGLFHAAGNIWSDEPAMQMRNV